MNHILSCREAKQQDLVVYLASLGYKPHKIRGNDYWYLSPLREEKEPSFKVNRKFNIWYDHGLGKGGNLIDFGILFYGCSVKELLQRLNNRFSFQQPTSAPRNPGKSQLVEDRSRIRIISQKMIESPRLVQYLNTRKISLDLAREHCSQVEFQLYGRLYSAIGFLNRSGGFELRNMNFKGSCTPKDISYIDNGRSSVSVFEGFFSYLSFYQVEKWIPNATNFLVLNSLAFLERSRPLMEQHEKINLFLDRDRTGQVYTEKALQWDRRYIDRSSYYAHYKDLNEWLQNQKPTLRQQCKSGKRL